MNTSATNSPLPLEEWKDHANDLVDTVPEIPDFFPSSPRPVARGDILVNERRDPVHLP